MSRRAKAKQAKLEASTAARLKAELEDLAAAKAEVDGLLAALDPPKPEPAVSSLPSSPAKSLPKIILKIPAKHQRVTMQNPVAPTKPALGLDTLPSDVLLAICQQIPGLWRILPLNKRFASIVQPLLLQRIQISEREPYKLESLCDMLATRPEIGHLVRHLCIGVMTTAPPVVNTSTGRPRGRPRKTPAPPVVDQSYAAFLDLLRMLGPHLSSLQTTIRGDVWADAGRKKDFLDCLPAMVQLRSYACLLPSPSTWRHMSAAEILNAAPASLQNLEVAASAAASGFQAGPWVPGLRSLRLGVLTGGEELRSIISNATNLRNLHLDREGLVESTGELRKAIQPVVNRLSYLEIHLGRPINIQISHALAYCRKLETLVIVGTASGPDMASLPRTLVELRLFDISAVNGEDPPWNALASYVNVGNLPKLARLCIGKRGWSDGWYEENRFLRLQDACFNKSVTLELQWKDPCSLGLRRTFSM